MLYKIKFQAEVSGNLIGSRVIDKHKYYLMEMQECFETYCMRKDHAEQILEIIKSSIKQQSLGDGDNHPVACSNEQKVDLCQKLYKLIFQLLLFYESYIKLLDCFKSIQSHSQVNDMTVQVESVREELTVAMTELENGQVSPLNVDSQNVHTKQEAFTSLLEYLKGLHYLKAIQLLRAFRSMWHGDMFGLSNDEDVVTLLNIYCVGLAEKKSGVFVLTKMDFDIGMLYNQLLDINQQLRMWAVPSPHPSVSECTDLLDSSTL